MIEIIQESNEDYLFTLKSESGSVLMNSVHFKNKNEAKRMVDSLKNSQPQKIAFERKTNHNGKFMFHLKQMNGNLVGTSQAYGSEAGMENGIQNVKKRIQQLSHLNQL